MPTGVYERSEELKLKMRLSHMKGWTSSYKKPKPKFTATGIPVRISKEMKGWTKWGGPRHGYETQEEEWYCQSCKEVQPDVFPSYLIDIQNGDLARICSKCYFQSIINQINNIFDLIRITRDKTFDLIT